jgi:large subunit ribosomal protein L1
MGKHGKKYQEAIAKVDRHKQYSPEEALQLAKDTSYTRFDSTVEVHIRLGVDPRHAEQQVRETVLLPHGTGKDVKVLAFAQGEGERKAEQAGADHIGNEETIKKIQGGWLDFDAAVATPDMMGKVGRLGKILGPRGLMPNPKAGTVVPEDDLDRVIKELKAGRVEFRAALMEAVKKARPASAKGTYVRKVSVTTTMGPGIRVDPSAAQAMEI